MRLFLVGVPRSGTTLMQALLTAHSKVTSFTESHFFHRAFRRIPGLGLVLVDNPAPRVAEFLAENDASEPEAARWFGPPMPTALRWTALRPFNTFLVARRLVGVLDGMAADRQMPVWLEKTPRHLHALPLLERVCNDGVPTRFVHVVRGGLQTVASLYEASRHWPHSYSVDECIDRWNEDIAITVRYLGKHGHHAVLYETLTADPETTLRNLFAELGLSWEPSVLDQFGDAGERLVTGDEHWKNGLRRAIRPSATAENRLDSEQYQRVVDGLRQDRYQAVVRHLNQVEHHG
jgi:hypothetical protein